MHSWLVFSGTTLHLSLLKVSENKLLEENMHSKHPKKPEPQQTTKKLNKKIPTTEMLPKENQATKPLLSS